MMDPNKDSTKKIMVPTATPSTPSDFHSINMTPSETTPLVAKKKPISFVMMIYAVCLMLSSGLFLSLCAAVIKWGASLNFGSMEMLMWRSGMQCVIAVITSIITFQARGEWSAFRALTNMELVYLACRGFTGGIGVACYFHAITLIPVGDAITVLSIYPVIAAFLAYFILKEHITFVHFLALIFAVIGVILISQPSFIFPHDQKDSG